MSLRGKPMDSEINLSMGHGRNDADGGTSRYWDRNLYRCPSAQQNWHWSGPRSGRDWLLTLCGRAQASIILIGNALQSSSSVICQTTGPKPLPKRFLHIVRSRASSFNRQYPLLSLSSSSSFLRLLSRLLVTSICPFIFPSITCCRRQFLRKMWPIQLAFLFLIS